jgi:uroporphyrinogen-III synthase
LPEPPSGVLVTRPEPGASRTGELLRALGHEPVLAPFLHVRPLTARLPDPASLQAVLAASGNAVAGLPPSHHGLPLLAVGAATAERARRAGFRQVESAEGDARALAALAGRRCDPAGAPILLAVGRGQGGGLATALRAGGFRVVRRAVYAALPVASFPESAAAALADRRIGAALFFSTETGRAFVRTLPAALNPALAAVRALAISESVARALDDLPWHSLGVAVRPTQEDVLALL